MSDDASTTPSKRTRKAPVEKKETKVETKKSVRKKAAAPTPHSDEEDAPPVKRGRGRPAGWTKSKGRGRPKKNKIVEKASSEEEDAE